MTLVLAPGDTVRFGNTDCQSFEIRFATRNNISEDYGLEAGRRYRFIFQDGHWDLEPD